MANRDDRSHTFLGRGTISVLATLRRLGIETDQRLSTALQLAGTYAKRVREDDTALFMALCKLNAVDLQLLIDQSTDPEVLTRAVESFDEATKGRLEADYTIGIASLSKVLDPAIYRLGATKTLGTGNVLLSLLEQGLEHGDNYNQRPYTVDLLCESHGNAKHSNLKDIPALGRTLEALRRRILVDGGIDDFQFVLALEEDRLVFRIASQLGDYVLEGDSGLWVPQRALLSR